MKGISFQKRVEGGAPCVQGTRVRTRYIYVLFMSGVNMPELQRAFGMKLTTQQVEQALRYEFRK